MTDFFIKRPMFAAVCSLVIVLFGAICIPLLPVSQYPDIEPVQITVTTRYQGASAEVVERTVTSLLERQLNGIEGVAYINSISSNDGSSLITVTFEQGFDKNVALLDVQNRVGLAEPQLPDLVRQTGVSVQKASNNVVMGMAVFADEGKYDETFISNYVDLYVIDALKRIPGVGDVNQFGERRYAMRIWLDPVRMAGNGLSAQDVVRVLQEQNLQVGAGQIGQPPSDKSHLFSLDLIARGRLTEAADFENLVLKVGANGALVKLKDVGRAELGAESYSTFARLSGKPALGLRIIQSPGGNALEIAREVKRVMDRLGKDFPPGLKYEIPYDPTQFIEESSREVLKTLYEAILLVVLVIFIFLQNWRATIIPVLTIPVSLIGTFLFVKIFGFSINSLTLFGLTLATGLVVDDAIIVIENIARHMEESRLSPIQAAVKAMREVGGAVVATSLVLMAVFIPVAFFPGTTGQLYKQFALTISFSISISAFVALTLTPALSVRLVRHESQPNRFFAAINRFLDRLGRLYARTLVFSLRRPVTVIGSFLAVVAATGWLTYTVPTAFLPEEDQGYFINIVQLPSGSSLNYTDLINQRVETELLHAPEVKATFAMGGVGINGSSPNSAFVFAPLKPWSERSGQNQSAPGIIARVQPSLGAISEGMVFSVNPPTIQGLGAVGGFVFQLQDRGNNGIPDLVRYKDEIIARANRAPELRGVFTTFSADTPQMDIDIDRNRAKAEGVQIQEILNSLQIYFGGRYVNDFNRFGRTYRVYAQAEQQYRMSPDRIGEISVRSDSGKMISLRDLIRLTPRTGPQTITHYNLHPSIEINGMAAPGYSSGQAMAAMERIAAEVLPRSMGYEWSGISREERASGNKAPIIFLLGLLFVLLVLAAQYGNLLDPAVILLAVPPGILGALAAQTSRGLANDVYCQIGMAMLIGLASKNAILIVEFANQLQARGLSPARATIAAARARLRPILMTSLAFILGLLPMVLARGAGGVSRQSLGTSVSGGMIASTVLGLIFVPTLYLAFGKLRKGGRRFGSILRSVLSRPTFLAPRKGHAGGIKAPAAGRTTLTLLVAGIIGSSVLTAEGFAQEKAPDTEPVVSGIVKKTTPEDQMAGSGDLPASKSPTSTGNGEKVLTIRDAVEMALQSNPEIRIERIRVRQAGTDVTRALGLYDTQLFGEFGFSADRTPAISPFAGGDAAGILRNRTLSGGFGIERPFAAGGRLEIQFTHQRTTTNNRFAGLNPLNTGEIRFEFTQPLGRDFKMNENRRMLLVARKRLDLSDAEFRQKVIDVIARTQAAYWELVFARREVEVKREGITLAEKQLRQSRNFVEAGTLAPVEIVAVEAQLERRREGFWASLENLNRAENALKSLVLENRQSVLWGATLKPAETTNLETVDLNPEGAIANALRNRPELARLALKTEENAIQIEFARNQLKPRVELFSRVSFIGVSGSRIPFVPGSPDPFPGNGLRNPFEGGIGNTFRDLATGRFPSVEIGIRFRFSPRNRIAKADFARATAERQVLEIQREALETEIEVEVRNGLHSVRTGYERVLAARSARIAAETQLESESRRFSAGQSTNFLVLERQNYLSEARAREIRALADYNLAIVRLQKSTSTILETNQIRLIPEP